MKFNGKFKNGKFIPDSSVEDKWKSFLARIERNDMNISIEVRKAEKVSDSQLGLFFVVVNMVAEVTGSNEEQVLINIEKFRPVEPNGTKKALINLNTNELKNFIDKSIIHLNEEFNLNIHLELLPSGETKVIC